MGDCLLERLEFTKAAVINDTFDDQRPYFWKSTFVEAIKIVRSKHLDPNVEIILREKAAKAAYLDKNYYSVIDLVLLYEWRW